MCIECWKNYGSDKIKSDKVTALTKLIQGVYEQRPTGGNLHCELDDWNIEDHHFVADEVHSYDMERSPILPVEAACYKAMKDATLAERNSALYWAFYEKRERCTSS